jgi:hypothetical protein
VIWKRDKGGGVYEERQKIIATRVKSIKREGSELFIVSK